MLELILGLIATIGIAAGIGVMVGPSALARLAGVRRLWPRGGRALATVLEPSAEIRLGALHPATQEVMQVADEVASRLASAGQRELARGLHQTAARLVVDEPGAVRALLTTCQRLRRAELGWRPRPGLLLDTVVDLERLLSDRGEQLEILPFR